MTDVAALFAPLILGRTELANRVALAPMTRVSGHADGRPTDRIGGYYRRFAAGGFGLLITEGLYTDEEASQGYIDQPGIATSQHAEAWKPLVAAVHEEGAKIFAQLMHAGAQSQGNSYVDETRGPSAIAPRGEQLPFYRGSGPYPVPAAMSAGDITAVREGFVRAAQFARTAGFDGVEIHGANGYLLDQFLTDYLNERTDQYGGDVDNRIRLTSEIAEDVVAAVGDDLTVGVRISQGKVSDAHHKWGGGVDDARVIFGRLGQTGIHFIHTTEYRAEAPAFEGSPVTLAEFAATYSGLPIIANGGLDSPSEAAALVQRGFVDVVALGKSALANRDWPVRALKGAHIEADVPDGVLGPLATLEDWETRPSA